MATLAFMVCCLSGMLCGVSAVFFMLRAASMRKSGIPWQSAVNILDVLFDASPYTEDGIRAARRCKQSIVGFVLCFALGLVIGISTGVAH